MNRVPAGIRRNASLAGSVVVHLVIIVGIGFIVPSIAIAPSPEQRLGVILNAPGNVTPPVHATHLGERNRGGEIAASGMPRTVPTTTGHLSGATSAATSQALRVAHRSTDAVIPVTVTLAAADSGRTAPLAPAAARHALRQIYLTAATRASVFARYMDAWRQRIETIGNHDYPAAIRWRGLSGNLVLDVAILADGRLDQVTVMRSSGDTLLDQTALGIVRAAAPFDPFPAAYRDRLDVLHITRTWQFLSTRMAGG